ncbi:hypothetical protein N7528_000177 [Penicillium herquei]|nr:hypothetical protein N7528_000177 [Penicillium herquei]
MESPRSWFRQGPFRNKYVPNAIISTQEPVPRDWRIVRVVVEHDKQIPKEFGEQGCFSFATIRLACCRAEIRAARSPSPDTEIRVYVQVPYTNTELDDPDVRAEQAVDFEPKELKAYKMMTSDESVSQFTPNLLGFEKAKQGDSGLVPGGFQITIAWQHLAGIRFGGPDLLSESAFWTLEKSQRDRIRIQFENQFMEMIRLGIFPEATEADNLLFDKTSGKLYWINFYDAIFKKNVIWSKSWFAIFDLAKSPRGDLSWTERDWQEDISGWKL